MVSPKDKLFGEKDRLFIPVQDSVHRNYLLSCQMVLNNVGLTESMSQPQSLLGDFLDLLESDHGLRAMHVSITRRNRNGLIEGVGCRKINFVT